MTMSNSASTSASNTSFSDTNSVPAAGTTTLRRRGQLVSNRSDTSIMVKVRRTPEIPTNGDNVVARRIPGTEVFIQVEKAADSQGYQWFLVYEKTPGDLGWVREDVLLEYLSAPNPSPSPSPSPNPNPTPPTQTQLFFTTGTSENVIYTVRVLRAQDQLSMNVYHNATERAEILGGSAVKLPPLEASPGVTSSNWQTYLTRTENRVYLARFIPSANTELVISDGVTGAIALRQAGFRAEGIAFTG